MSALTSMAHIVVPCHHVNIHVEIGEAAWNSNRIPTCRLPDILSVGFKFHTTPCIQPHIGLPAPLYGGGWCDLSPFDPTSMAEGSPITQLTHKRATLLGQRTHLLKINKTLRGDFRITSCPTRSHLVNSVSKSTSQC